MTLDIAVSESAYLEGKAKWEQWHARFTGEYMAPLGVTQLAMLGASLTPEVRAQLEQMNPQALADLNRTLQLAPDFAQALHTRGVLYRQMKQFDVAINDLSTAIDLTPQNPVLYKDRGTAYYLSQQLGAPVQRGQVVHRNAREVVVLDVVVGAQEDAVPQQGARPHERAPVGGIVGVDVVVLPEAVERERDGKHQEDG